MKILKNFTGVGNLSSLVIKDGLVQVTDGYKTYTSVCDLGFNGYVNANDFASFYTNDCEVKDGDKDIVIKKGKSKLSLKKIVSDRNILPINKEGGFVFDTNELIKGIKFVKDCVKPKSFMPILTGVYIRCDGENMFVVGASAHYVGEYLFKCKGIVGESVLPIAYTSSLLSHLSEGGEFSIVLGKNMVIYNDTSSSSYSCIDGQFVPYQTFIKETENKLKINSKELLDSINCGVVIDTPILHLNNGKGFIKGELNSIEFDYSYEGCEHNIKFSVGDFSNLLGKSNEFVLNITDNVSPVTFKGDNVTYVLMPIK